MPSPFWYDFQKPQMFFFYSSFCFTNRKVFSPIKNLNLCVQQWMIFEDRIVLFFYLKSNLIIWIFVVPSPYWWDFQKPQNVIFDSIFFFTNRRFLNVSIKNLNLIVAVSNEWSRVVRFSIFRRNICHEKENIWMIYVCTIWI